MEQLKGDGAMRGVKVLLPSFAVISALAGNASAGVCDYRLSHLVNPPAATTVVSLG